MEGAALLGVGNVAGKSSIEWTDCTWNPVRGCSRISAGCANCYAEVITGRFSKPGGFGHTFAIYDDRGPRWTGKVELVEKHLEDPLRWKKPRRIFVNSMSDLFHEALDGPTIARVFAVMALAPRHTFQVLTKRAAKMREILNDEAFRSEVWAARDAMIDAGVRCEGKFTHHVEREPHDGHRVVLSDYSPGPTWPLPNVWLGVSVEDQAAADVRIPELIETPAAVRFLSCEPLLGPISLAGFGARKWTLRGHDHPTEPWEGIQWAIVGGESGHGARPGEMAWIRSIVEQCQAAGVAPFVKQLGTVLGGRDHHNIDTFPADLRVREFPRA